MNNRLLLSLASLSFFSVLLTGCGLGPIRSSEIPATAQTTISGKVMGGHSPIGGALMQLWQTGTSGYGAGATQLIASTYTDAGTGAFVFPTSNVPANCTAGPFAYLTATGGDSQGGTQVNTNPAIKFVAVVGACNGVGATTVISINEATTVAAAYALRSFASDSTTSAAAGDILIGAPSSNSQGLADAVANAQLLVSSASGYASASSAGVLLPSAMIYTLANSISACVNTASRTSSNCTNLYSYATPPYTGAAAPADTFQALMNIAAYPGNQVSNIVALGPAAGAPFQPSLSYTVSSTQVLNDLTLGIAYTNGTLAAVTSNFPQAIAIDDSDNVFTFGGANPTYMATLTNASGGQTLTNAQMSSIALPTSGSPQFEQATVDGVTPTPNIWIANMDAAGDVIKVPGENATNASYIYLKDPAGQTGPYTGSASATIAANTYGISIDASNNIWTSSYVSSGNCAAIGAATANSICEYQELPAAGTAFTNTFGSTPVEEPTGSARAVLYDANTNAAGASYKNRVWAANAASGGSVAYAGDVSALKVSDGSEIFIRVGSVSNVPTGLGLDSSSNLWVTLAGGGVNSTLYKVANNQGSSPTTAAGVPAGSYYPTTISSPKTSPSGQPTSSPFVNGARYLAIDGAGNIFVANYSYSAIVQYNPTIAYNNGTARTGGYLSPFYGFSPSLAQNAVNIGGFSVTSNVITLFAANNLAAGNTVTLSGFTGAYTSLNGVTLTVATANTYRFTASYTASDQARVTTSGQGAITGSSETVLSCPTGTTCAVTQGFANSPYTIAIDRAGTVWTVSTSGTLVGIIGPGAPTNPLNSAGQYGVLP